LEIKLELVADGEDENDVFEKGVDSAHFRVSAGSRYESLLRNPVIKCPSRINPSVYPVWPFKSGCNKYEASTVQYNCQGWSLNA
jgi:hypothetical protein